MSAVEWKTLGEVAVLSRGVVISKDYLRDNEGVYPVYSSQTANDGELGRISTYNYDGEFLTWTTDGANAGTIFHRFGKFSITNVCGLIGVKNKSELIYRYLFYWLSIVAKKYVSEGMGNPKLMSNVMGSILIPMIPLSRQQAIVSHLDAFTTLISSLESELEKRRKQYEHYRNQLLEFEGVDGVEWKTLGDIGEFVRGNGIQKKDFIEDGYGCIHYGQVYTQFKLLAYETITGVDKDLYDKCRKAKHGDIVLATTSENLEDVAKPVIWLGDEEIAISGDAFIYKHNQNPIFIGSQFLTDRFSKFKGMNAKGAKVIRITGDSMAEYKIALPSLEKQNAIADSIKNFEQLIQSLESEIKLRKQQYEYYREKLLTFE